MHRGNIQTFNTNVITTTGVWVGILEIAPRGVDRTAELYEIKLSTEDIVQDANELMMDLRIYKNTTHTSGAAIASVPVLPGDSAIGNICDASVTATMSGDLMYQFYWNMRHPFRHIFMPKARPMFITGVSSYICLVGKQESGGNVGVRINCLYKAMNY
jgi:hypothetical protein